MPETELETNSDGSIDTPDANVQIVDDSPEKSELAPGTEGSQEKVKEPTPEERNKTLEESLAQSKFERRRERREREQAEHDLAQLQADRSAQTAKRADIPDMPGQYDDDYAELMESRDEAIREAARFDANVDIESQRRAYDLEQSQYQQRQVMQKTADTFKEKATQLGISDAELQQNGERLLQYQALTQDEISLILTDDQGPLIAKYLSQNPVELERIASLPVGSSARMSMLLTDIKPKAAALKAKTTSTPDPLDSINGNSGSASDKFPGTKGMTFT